MKPITIVMGLCKSRYVGAPVAIYVVYVCNTRSEQFAKGILIVYYNNCILMILVDHALWDSFPLSKMAKCKLLFIGHSGSR